MAKHPLVSRLAALFQKHRRRLSTLVLGIFVAAVIVQIGSAIPRAVQVDVPLGAGHAEVTEARIDYWQDDEPVRSITRRWPNGAPASVRDTLDLSPGEYDVSVTLVDRSGDRRALSGHLKAPGDGVIHLSLEAS